MPHTEEVKEAKVKLKFASEPTEKEVKDSAVEQIDRTEPIGLMSTVYKDKYGRNKHYLKYRPEFREVEETVRQGVRMMIFSDDGTEVQYHVNLLPSELKNYNIS